MLSEAVPYGRKTQRSSLVGVDLCEQISHIITALNPFTGGSTWKRCR